MRPLGLVVVVPLACLACGELIGIEEAHHDSSMDPSSPKTGSAGASGSEDEELPSCEEYCSSVMTHCQGDVAQYVDEPMCLDVCARLPEGSAESLKENSVSCRARQADLARIEPLVHCTLAGPTGGGECGTPCEAFCGLMTTVCAADSGVDHYADTAECLEDCGKATDLGTFGIAMTSGSTLQCRYYHLLAATEDPGRHCPHAMGKGPCQ